ncbi:hypothetical protein JW916_03795 [Candidatus Sumerlaeota bacterium]|nr:hypothetical protein [Candidatus Sumerlaeota bacterium]
MVRTTGFLALLLLFTGCAMWRSDIDPNSRRYEPARLSAGKPVEKKSLLLNIGVEHWANGESASDSDVNRVPPFAKRATRLFRESGLFREVGTKVSHPDLELIVNVKEEERFSRVLAALCGITFLVIPAYDRVEYECTGYLKNAEGEESDVLAEVTAKGEMKAVVGWLLLPAAPFSFSTQRRAIDDLFKSVLVQLAENEKVWK